MNECSQRRDVFSALAGVPDRMPVLMLAPMEGLSCPILRDLIIKQGGLHTVATEFVRITSAKQRIQDPVRHSIPLQIQFMSPDGRLLCDLLKQLQDRGQITQDDWLDLNVGCPSRRVNSRGAGAALLKQPEKIIEIVSALREIHRGPLSIKARVGVDSDCGYARLLELLSYAPLDFITIHARTRSQGFDGDANWDYLTRAVEMLPYPVIGNGDVWSVEDAIRMWRQTGVRGVMCGRGALRNPALFTQIRDTLCSLYSSGIGGDIRVQELDSLPLLKPSAPADLQKQIFKFICDLHGAFAEAEPSEGRRYIGPFKEISVWLSRNELVGRDFFNEVKRCNTLADVAPILASLLLKTLS